jgi:hypothetical protein
MCLKATLPSLDERSANLWAQFQSLCVRNCRLAAFQSSCDVFKNLTELCEVLSEPSDRLAEQLDNLRRPV